MTRSRWAPALTALTAVVGLTLAVACSSSGEPEIARPIVATTTIVDSSPAAGGDQSRTAGADDDTVESGVESAADDAPDTSTDDVGDDATVGEGTAESNDGGSAGTEADIEDDIETDDASETGATAPAGDDSDDSGGSDEGGSSDAATSDGGSSSGGTSGSNRSGRGGGSSDASQTFSGDALVGDASPPPSECAATADECIPATCFAAEPDVCGGDIPTSVVSMGEYQSGIRVPDGARVDVYFDQSRTEEEMRRRCENGGGDLTQRGQDGSRWAGWWYCQIYPVTESAP